MGTERHTAYYGGEMTDTDYTRVANAIAYIVEHAVDQPPLEQIADRVGLSPFHFQRTFRRYAGVTPKQFLAALTVESAKGLLDQEETVLGAALDVGLSSPARLHDRFVSIEAMSPGEYKSGGAGLEITYGFAQSPFGLMLAAKTSRGICMLEFIENSQFDPSQTTLPNARYRRNDGVATEVVAQLFGETHAESIPLHVRGTNFQIRVWNALLGIAPGSVTTYGRVANTLDMGGGARAVGRAVGSNPVAFLIPCHRVIAQTGAITGYRWGPERKRALLTWERARSVPSA